MVLDFFASFLYQDKNEELNASKFTNLLEYLSNAFNLLNERMNQVRTIIFISITFLFIPSFAQVKLANKVFETGAKIHFNNFKKCDFYFECDCCSGKILFTTSTEFLMIDYCMSDFVVTKGTYSLSQNEVELKFDGSRIDVKYNWERETDPDAKPAYFVNDSTIAKTQLKFMVDSCERTMLVNKQKNNTFIAIETELLLSDELDRLKKYNPSQFLNLK